MIIAPLFVFYLVSGRLRIKLRRSGTNFPTDSICFIILIISKVINALSPGSSFSASVSGKQTINCHPEREIVCRKGHYGEVFGIFLRDSRITGNKIVKE